MVLGESVIVQEGPVLITSSLCFSMKGHEWMSDVHCLQGQVALVTGVDGLGASLPMRWLTKEYGTLFV